MKKRMRNILVYSIIGIIFLSGALAMIFLRDDVIVVDEFNYTYNHMVSHICPGITETFEVIYEGVYISVTAREKRFIENRGRFIEDYSECENQGTLMNFYDPSVGFLEGCEIMNVLGLPESPEYFEAVCKTEIEFVIKDSSSFKDCSSSGNCQFVNGVEVKFR